MLFKAYVAISYD